MLKTTLDMEYKQGVKRASRTFITFRLSSDKSMYAYISSYIIKRMGFPKYVHIAFDEDTGVMYFEPSVNENDMRCYKNGDNCNGRNIVITTFMKYCKLPVNDYKGRYYAQIKDGKWCINCEKAN